MESLNNKIKKTDTHYLLVLIHRYMYGIGFFFEPFWGAYIKYYTQDSDHESILARFLMSAFLGVCFIFSLQKDFYTKYHRIITVLLIASYNIQRYYILSLNPDGWNVIIDCYTIALISIMVAPTVKDLIWISVTILLAGLIYREHDAALFFNMLTAIPLFASFKYLTLTEHIQLENSKKQIRDEGLLSGAKSFIGTISHDINNNLQKISLLNNLASLTKDPKELDKIQKKINLEIEKTSLIMTSFKDIINVEEPAPAYYNNAVLINRSMHLFQDHIKNSKIILYMNHSPMHIYIDEKVFKNMIQPIVKNAIDVLRSISCTSHIKRIKIISREDENNVYISVANSGPKIEKNIENKIFDAFFTTKNIGNGIGLGLSIARDVAQRNNCHIYYDKNQPETTFTIRIPKNQELTSIE